MCPVRVTTPFLACTPISLALTEASQSSSAMTSCCSCRSVFMSVFQLGELTCSLLGLSSLIGVLARIAKKSVSKCGGPAQNVRGIDVLPLLRRPLARCDRFSFYHLERAAEGRFATEPLLCG